LYFDLLTALLPDEVSLKIVVRSKIKDLALNLAGNWFLVYQKQLKSNGIEKKFRYW